MSILLVLLASLSLLVFPFSLVALAFRRLRPTARWIAPTSVGVFIVSCILLGAAEDEPPQPVQANAAKVVGEKVRSQTYTSRSDALKHVSLSSLKWQKGGLGMTMTASFVISNNNRFAVKDLEIRCNNSAASGTQMDSNARTLYVNILANQYLSVPDMEMGFIHHQVVATKCSVIDLAPG